jgi:alkylhydroperoxidase/carboxymuconolactone decarboxylase family protein YurZ
LLILIAGVLTVHLEYGMYMSETKILSPIETSMTTIASLLPMDVPTQVRWHMRGLLRNNGTEEQILEALKVAKGAVDVSGVVLKGSIPEVGDLMKENMS